MSASHQHLDRHTLRLHEGGGEMAFRYLKGGLARIGARGEGQFDGEEEPVHLVKIAPFWMAETPVTQRQFAAFAPDHDNHFKDKPEHPAENMDWRQANAFCAELQKQCTDGFPDGFKAAALPTEAEWEYACRAGEETEFHSGDGEAALIAAGWHGEEWEKGSTHRVRKKAANAFHLSDAHGDVWEWCFDEFDQSSYRSRIDGEVDLNVSVRANTLPSEVPKDSLRVLRGGSWYASARLCRSALRNGYHADYRVRNVGFRVCLLPGPAEPGTARAAPDGGREAERSESARP